MSREPNIIQSFSHAVRGIFEVARSERNFRVHVFFTLLAVVLGIWFQIAKFEWLILAIVISAVLILEIMNAVVERLVDLVKPRLHPILHDVKDMMAGAVLISAMCAVFVGLLIFLPRLVAMFAV